MLATILLKHCKLYLNKSQNKITNVSVNEIKGEQITILEIKVAPEYMGKVIGKEGRIARSIRTIMKAAASISHKRVSVEIIQN